MAIAEPFKMGSIAILLCQKVLSRTPGWASSAVAQGPKGSGAFESLIAFIICHFPAWLAVVVRLASFGNPSNHRAALWHQAAD
jgi:hypothetical protein